MKRLLLLSIIATLLSGCAGTMTDEERIDEANAFCMLRGYPYIKVYREYGEISEIYCSLGQRTKQLTYPLSNPDVPHE